MGLPDSPNGTRSALLGKNVSDAIGQQATNRISVANHWYGLLIDGASAFVLRVTPGPGVFHHEICEISVGEALYYRRLFGSHFG
jgi:hypothetical protein